MKNMNEKFFSKAMKLFYLKGIPDPESSVGYLDARFHKENAQTLLKSKKLVEIHIHFPSEFISNEVLAELCRCFNFSLTLFRHKNATKINGVILEELISSHFTWSTEESIVSCIESISRIFDKLGLHFQRIRAEIPLKKCFLPEPGDLIETHIQISRDSWDNISNFFSKKDLEVYLLSSSINCPVKVKSKTLYYITSNSKYNHTEIFNRLKNKCNPISIQRELVLYDSFSL
ncbi:hypothetical protein SAMN05216326_14512 [Nitrosomonas marina]|uniref:Uncharacterized protein n=1 Tax=Nitrosomonas marina TaxID=917 RepID=A0A1I0FW58_9PROT|nr:hypothetical protein [Nitrosomonas marina]SET61898.1 hypothetical protein SAMN05216326_14512 [Nitrosomonas marina]